MNKFLKKGDKVCILTGNDKGRDGQIIGFKKDRVLVQGINVRKKHVKRTSQDQPAQIIDIECPIDRSNVAICNDEGKRLNLKVKITDGKKELVYSVDGKEKVYRNIR